MVLQVLLDPLVFFLLSHVLIKLIVSMNLLLMFCLIGAIGALIGRNQFNACHMRGTISYFPNM